MIVDESISNTITVIPIIILNFYERIHEISVDNHASQHFLEKHPVLVVCSNFSKAWRKPC